MSIQQDILDTIGAGGIEVGALQKAVGNIGAKELDCAVAALLRARRVRVVLDRYVLVPSTKPIGGLSHAGPPPSADEKAADSRQNKKRDVLVPVAHAPGGSEPAPTSSAVPSYQQVFEHVKAERQKASNRIAVLEVDLANERSRLTRCDAFLEVYELFADEANS